MKKFFTTIFLSLILVFSLTACGSKKNTSCQINIASLKGPTSIGLVKLYSDSDSGKTYNEYSYNIYATADEISTGIVKGDIDVAAVPANLAAVLYNKTNGGIRIAGINTLGVLYILSKGVEINDISDLKGQTIYTTGEGTTPEYTLKYILSENGIDPENDVSIEFFSEASEVVSNVSVMDSAVVMLPEPYVEVAKNTDSELKDALNLTEEWEKIGDNGTIATGVIIVRTEFLNNHKDAFNEFLKEYKESTDYANTNVDETADLVESFDIFKAAIAKKAIPNCNITLITGSDMTEKLNGYFKVLYDYNAASVGGTLPDGDAFYEKEIN